ncbi:MAG: MBL fold metallo-hydrolase [Pseudomonadota bacterium]
MRFACLGSGSRGNAWLVEAGATRLLVDCGFSARETARRLARLGVAADSIDALLLTHEHADHARGLAGFAARYGSVVWLTHGARTMLQAMDALPGRVREIDSHSVFALGDLEITPVAVPHDAREPVQFVLSDGRRRLGILTDAGHVTAHMEAMFSGCDALAIECNHDVELLRQGSYPPALKARILGRYGHLDNGTAQQLLARLATDRLQHVLAAHLSEENNRPELARRALAGALGCADDWIGVADQERGSDWRQIV